MFSAGTSVIDHKALWRANLYIAKTGGDGDWNNLYPWNAPPAAGIEPDGGTPWWWSAEYGVNEWNRRHDGTTPFTNIEGLAAGDGGQTVAVSAFTPIWPGLNGQYERSTAYSYPYNWTDGHMDSPFDHNRKLIEEKTAIQQWWSLPSQVAQFADGETPDSMGSQMALNTLQTWPLTTAPINKWGNYVERNFTNQTGNFIRTFMPGLGLYYDHPEFTMGPDVADINAGQVVNLVGDNRTASMTNPFPIGTDCIGFAQRVMQYAGNSYKWGDLSTSWTEGGLLYPNCAGGRLYPTLERQLSELIIARLDLPASNRVKNVYPGDILYYGVDHIAIVQSVTYEETGTAPISSIKIIEAIFNHGEDYQTVINERNLTSSIISDKPWKIVRLVTE